jgi:hypothetical protein
LPKMALKNALVEYCTPACSSPAPAHRLRITVLKSMYVRLHPGPAFGRCPHGAPSSLAVRSAGRTSACRCAPHSAASHGGRPYGLLAPESGITYRRCASGSRESRCPCVNQGTENKNKTKTLAAGEKTLNWSRSVLGLSRLLLCT